MNSARATSLFLRCGLLLAAGTASTLGLGRLCLAVLGPLTGPLRAHGLLAVARLPFPQVVVALAVLALLGCWLRVAGPAALFAVAVVHAALRPSSGGCRRRRFATPLVRRTVLAALGVGLPAVVLLPAHAVPRGPDGLAGLPLPDRTLGTQQPLRTVTVHAGDCLWSIARTLLAGGVGARQVAREVEALHAANASVIGSDADLIFPGTRLVVPRHDRPGKEQP
jgi:hypothetical protein